MNETFNPLILAADVDEVGRIYADFFTGLSEHNWRKPVKGWPKEESPEELSTNRSYDYLAGRLIEQGFIDAFYMY